MRNPSHILKALKETGHRSTIIRKIMLDLLIKSPEPLSSPEIQKVLIKNKLSVNKTTVYRELSLLKKQGFIRELQMGDTAKRYEIMPENHHHHIICLDCDKVEDVEMDKELEKEEKKIIKNKSFKIINHSLEFYGICKNCQ